jgi:hypothetical protein
MTIFYCLIFETPSTWRARSSYLYPAGYYIGETSRPLEASIKEHKYDLTHGLLEKSKLAA